MLALRNYSPFGLGLEGSNQNINYQNPYKYTGKEENSFTGYYDFGARWSDPTIGNRFLQIDRFADFFEKVSPYQYGFNNPFIYIDPSGDSTIQVQDLDMHTFNVKNDQVQLPEIKVTSKSSDNQTSNATIGVAVLTYPAYQNLLPSGTQILEGLTNLAKRVVTVPLMVAAMVLTPTQLGSAHREVQPLGNRLYYTPPPKNLPGFPDAQRSKPKAGRARWVTPDGEILEWDSQHGEVEVYNKRGKHKGVADPNTGKIIKPEVPGRETPK